MDEIRRIGLDQLEALYATTESWKALIAALEKELATPRSNSDEADLLRRLARVHQRQAEACLARAQTLVPEEPLASVVRLPLPATSADDPLLESARLAAEGAIDEAIQLLLVRLADDPGAVELSIALEQLYRDGGRWDDLSVALIHRAERTDEIEQRIELLCSAARVSREELSDGYQAMELYRQVLELDEANPQAIVQLDALYTEYEMLEQLIQLLQLRCDLSESPEQRIAFMYRIATIYEVQLADTERAVDRLQEILNCDPDSEQALRRLEQIYQREQRWQELVEILERRAALSVNEAARVKLLMQIGELYAVLLEAPDLALGAAKRILEIDPAHKEANQLIAQLSTD